MGGSRRVWGLSPVPILLSCAGCASPNLVTAQRLSQGYVVVLPGVENSVSTVAGVVTGLRDAGASYALEINQWGRYPFDMLDNLIRYEVNRRKAAAVAEMLARYRQMHPDAPLVLIGCSGGGGMALFVAEALPPDVKLDRIILLCVAVSPSYDLTAALARCRKGIVSFYSEGDWLLLGWGTRTFGTMDRVYTDAAGRVGFRGPDGSLLRTPGLDQIAWRPEWRRLGNWGTHTGWFSRAWVREVLAPEVDSGVTPEGHR